MAKKTPETPAAVAAPFTTEAPKAPTLPERLKEIGRRSVRLVSGPGISAGPGATVTTPHGTYVDGPAVRNFFAIEALMSDLKRLTDEVSAVAITRADAAARLRAMVDAAGPVIAEVASSYRDRLEDLAALLEGDGPLPDASHGTGNLPTRLLHIWRSMSFSSQLPGGLLADAERAPDKYTVTEDRNLSRKAQPRSH